MVDVDVEMIPRINVGFGTALLPLRPWFTPTLSRFHRLSTPRDPDQHALPRELVVAPCVVGDSVGDSENVEARLYLTY